MHQQTDNNAINFQIQYNSIPLSCYLKNELFIMVSLILMAILTLSIAYNDLWPTLNFRIIHLAYIPFEHETLLWTIISLSHLHMLQWN